MNGCVTIEHVYHDSLESSGVSIDYRLWRTGNWSEEQGMEGRYYYTEDV